MMVDEQLRAQAAGLNRRLYEDNPDINPSLVDFVDLQIEAIGLALGYPPAYREAWHQHRYRLAATIEAMRPILRPGLRVLEIGQHTLTTDLINDHFPGLQLSFTEWDIRSPWACEPDSFDVIICMEVLEHLSDLPKGLGETVEFTGIKAYLEQAFRALRPGGVMFATTPNSTSIVCLRNLMLGVPGFFYRLHFREYARYELTEFIEQAGFAIDVFRSVYCLTRATPIDYTPVYEALLAHGMPLDDRGDDWFITVRKPGGAGKVG